MCYARVRVGTLNRPFRLVLGLVGQGGRHRTVQVPVVCCSMYRICCGTEHTPSIDAHRQRNVLICTLCKATEPPPVAPCMLWGPMYVAYTYVCYPYVM